MVATKLGVFEELQNKSKTAIEIAQHLKTDRRATEKLLTCLVGSGYLRFKSSSATAYRAMACKWLLKDSPVLHDNMLHRFLEWDVIESFEDFVRT